MNNLAFGNQKPDKICPPIEEKLRKELGATAPLPYQVEEQAVQAASVGKVMSDMAHALFTGKTEELFKINFDLNAPRQAKLQIYLSRQGIGAHVGLLLYSTTLAKPVTGEVTLENPKMFGTSKFTGDVGTATKLNNNGDLLKRLGKFSRMQAEIGGLTVSINRLVKIAPQDGTTLVVIGTLPRITSMGMDANLDAMEFFDLVALIEKAL